MKMNIRRIIALAISVIMVLSMIPVMAISTSAADVEGDWTIYRDPEKYDVEEGETIKPDPGYVYTDDGFTTIAPDWSNYTPFFAVQTKEPQPLKEGVYLKVRIDEYPYGGEDGSADHWLSLNISDREGIHPGNIEKENNWLCLLRGSGDGAAQLQNFLTTKTTEEAVGSFAMQESPNIEVPMDDQGREIYTLEVTWDGSAYELKVNGTVVSNPTINDALNAWVESGEYYLGFVAHSGVPDASASITILEYGTSASDATTPVGSDSLDPEENMLVFGEKIDPSTVAANTPALLWDATMATFNTDPKGADVQLVAQGDNSYHVTASGGAPYWTWQPKNDLTYSIADFPVFSMVVKNYWDGNGSLRFCAGDIMSPNDQYITSWSIFDEGSLSFGEEEEYSLVVVDLNDLGLIDEAMLARDGRIHNVMISFSVSDTTDPTMAEWDTMYMGWFRSVEEAQQYAIDRLEMNPTTEAPETDPPADDKTPAGDDKTPAGDDKTPAGDDKTPAGDDKTPAGDDKTPAGDETNAGTNAAGDDKQTDKADDEGGCASVIGMSAVAVLAAAAAAVVLKKKD